MRDLSPAAQRKVRTRAKLIAGGATAKKPSKFRNRKTVLDGITFDSKHEAQRWQYLRLLERGAQIRDLRRQVRFPLAVNGRLICHYVADFVYMEGLGLGTRMVVEDAKGFRTPEYKLKRKLMKAIHEIVVMEV